MKFLPSVISVLPVVLATLCGYANGALPFVPKDVSTSKFVTTGDNRVLNIYFGDASHNCSYPNDPKTIEDVIEMARANASSQGQAVRCDQCVEYQVPVPEGLVAFCSVGSSDNFTVRTDYYSDGATCQKPLDPDEHPPVQHTYMLGKKYGYTSTAGSQICSPQPPKPKCTTRTSPIRSPHHCAHADCDPVTCKDHNDASSYCCYWLYGESMSAYFQYYVVETTTVTGEISV